MGVMTTISVIIIAIIFITIIGFGAQGRSELYHIPSLRSSLMPRSRVKVLGWVASSTVHQPSHSSGFLSGLIPVTSCLLVQRRFDVRVGGLCGRAGCPGFASRQVQCGRRPVYGQRSRLVVLDKWPSRRSCSLHTPETCLLRGGERREFLVRVGAFPEQSRGCSFTKGVQQP